MNLLPVNLRTHETPLRTAVVLGVEHPRAAAVVQSLGRMGVPVIAVDHDRTARGMYSRYIARKVFVEANADAALAALEPLGDDAKPVLIPTNDRYLTLVSQHADRLRARFTLTTPSWDVLGRLMNKARCYALAQSIGVGVPRFFTPANERDLDAAIGQLDFARRDYVLTKALPIAEPTDVSSRRFTRVAGRDASTVRARCSEVAARTGEWPMITEVVPGPSETCVGVSIVLDPVGEPVAWFAVKRLQLRPYEQDEGFVHPYELGANVYCESIHDDQAVSAAVRLLQAAGYVGVATVEFRRDAADGELKLIKVDPRFVRATALSRALGVDLPRALYGAFTGAATAATPAYPAGVGWIWASWYLETVRAQGSRVLWRRVAGLLRERRIRAAAYFSVRDPMPFVVDGWRWSVGWARNKRRGFTRKLGVAVRCRRLPVSATDT